MHWRFYRAFKSMTALLLAIAANPAAARRTVIDSNALFVVSGYCSPGAAGTADCSAQELSFAIQIGGETYNSFYVNSNGTVSFTSIEAQLAAQNSFDGFPEPETYTGPPPADSLADYPAPIFSPFFLDGPGDPTTFDFAQDFDGELVARTSISDSSFTIDWFACPGPLTCGAASVELIQNTEYENSFGLAEVFFNFSTLTCCTLEEIFESGRQPLLDLLTGTLPVYTMTLTDLTNGFQVDYTYNNPALGEIGLYGFNLPSGLYEVSGPLANRSFLFNSEGGPVNPVPEPGTWMTMLLGFGLAGCALRSAARKRAQRT
jgi:hypothetical protein